MSKNKVETDRKNIPKYFAAAGTDNAEATADADTDSDNAFVIDMTGFSAAEKEIGLQISNDARAKTEPVGGKKEKIAPDKSSIHIEKFSADNAAVCKKRLKLRKSDRNSRSNITPSRAMKPKLLRSGKSGEFEETEHKSSMFEEEHRHLGFKNVEVEMKPVSDTSGKRLNNQGLYNIEKSKTEWVTRDKYQRPNNSESSALAIEVDSQSKPRGYGRVKSCVEKYTGVTHNERKVPINKKKECSKQSYLEKNMDEVITETAQKSPFKASVKIGNMNDIKKENGTSSQNLRKANYVDTLTGCSLSLESLSESRNAGIPGRSDNFGTQDKASGNSRNNSKSEPKFAIGADETKPDNTHSFVCFDVKGREATNLQTVNVDVTVCDSDKNTDKYGENKLPGVSQNLWGAGLTCTDDRISVNSEIKNNEQKVALASDKNIGVPVVNNKKDTVCETLKKFNDNDLSQSKDCSEMCIKGGSEVCVSCTDETKLFSGYAEYLHSLKNYKQKDAFATDETTGMTVADNKMDTVCETLKKYNDDDSSQGIGCSEMCKSALINVNDLQHKAETYSNKNEDKYFEATKMDSVSGDDKQIHSKVKSSPINNLPSSVSGVLNVNKSVNLETDDVDRKSEDSALLVASGTMHNAGSAEHLDDSGTDERKLFSGNAEYLHSFMRKSVGKPNKEISMTMTSDTPCSDKHVKSLEDIKHSTFILRNAEPGVTRDLLSDSDCTFKKDNADKSNSLTLHCAKDPELDNVTGFISSGENVTSVNLKSGQMVHNKSSKDNTSRSIRQNRGAEIHHDFVFTHDMATCHTPDANKNREGISQSISVERKSFKTSQSYQDGDVVCSQKNAFQFKEVHRLPCVSEDNSLNFRDGIAEARQNRPASEGRNQVLTMDSPSVRPKDPSLYRSGIRTNYRVPGRSSSAEYGSQFTSQTYDTRGFRPQPGWKSDDSVERRGSYSIHSGMSCDCPYHVGRAAGAGRTLSAHRMNRTSESNQSYLTGLSEGPICRICQEGDDQEVLVSPCYCAGSLGLLHISCLQKWLGASNKTSCEICSFEFLVERKPMPISHFIRDPGTVADRRNIICDLVCVSLISPLTVVTTYLCISGAMKYYTVDRWERSGLLFLSGLLMGLYLIWLAVMLKHNYALWRDWKMFHQEVTLLAAPTIKVAKKANQTPADDPAGSIRSLRSRSSVERVQLQSVRICVSGPIGRHKPKEGLGSPRLGSGTSPKQTKNLPNLPPFYKSPSSKGSTRKSSHSPSSSHVLSSDTSKHQQTPSKCSIVGNLQDPQQFDHKRRLDYDIQQKERQDYRDLPRLGDIYPSCSTRQTPRSDVRIKSLKGQEDLIADKLEDRLAASQPHYGHPSPGYREQFSPAKYGHIKQRSPGKIYDASFQKSPAQTHDRRVLKSDRLESLSGSMKASYKQRSQTNYRSPSIYNPEVSQQQSPVRSVESSIIDEYTQTASETDNKYQGKILRKEEIKRTSVSGRRLFTDSEIFSRGSSPVSLQAGTQTDGTGKAIHSDSSTTDTYVTSLSSQEDKASSL